MASSGEALQRTFAVDVLDADAGPKLISAFAIVLEIRPKVEREATGKAPPCFREIAGDSRYVEGKVERDEGSSRNYSRMHTKGVVCTVAQLTPVTAQLTAVAA
jgi:hypothetical protein